MNNKANDVVPSSGSLENNINANDSESLGKEIQVVLNNVTDYAGECTSLISALCQKMEDKDISTQMGLSFLEVKNHLLLQYLTSIAGVSLTKISGKSIQGCSYVDQLVELRTVLEKIRPIDNKLKYQIDKLVRGATTGAVESDPLRHRANPDNLIGAEDYSSDDDEDNIVNKPKSDVYQPPRVAPQHYDGDDEAPEKKMEKAKKTYINRNLIREMQEELLETPVEVHNRGDSFSANLQREVKDKERFEETFMTRLPTTKQEKHRMNSVSTMGVIADEITDFTGKFNRAVKNKGTKRKLKGKGKKGGGKKRFRK